MTTDAALRQTPPHDVEAERAVLGAILLWPECLPAVVEILPTPAAFYRPAHARIYAAALAIHRAGEPVEGLTVLRRLRAEKLDAEVGGATYLGALSGALPTASNAAYYAGLVRACADARALHTASLTAAARLQEGAGGPLSERVSEARAILAAAEPTGAESWPDPTPLGPPPPPPFPLDQLPVVLGEWAWYTARALQVPGDLPALLALAACATAVQRRAEVAVHEGWRETLSLFVAPILPPGSRKSPVFDAAMAPIHDWERDAAQGPLGAACARAESTHRILEDKLRSAESRAARGKDEAERDAAALEAADLSTALAASTPPRVPRLVTTDATPEALPRLMLAHGGRIAALSDEGGILETLGGRYSRGVANLDAILKAFTGSAITVDRSSGAVQIRRPALTIALTLQPSVLEKLGEEFTGRGVLARFFWALPASGLGSRLSPEHAQPVPPEITASYTAALRRLLGPPPESLDALRSYVPEEPRRLFLGAAARRVVYAWASEIEPRLAPGKDLSSEAIQGWAGKAPGLAARLAGIFHLVETASADLGGEPEISEDTAARAVAVGRYALAHAVAVLAGEAAEAKPLALARHVVAWLKAKGLSSFTRGTLTRASVARGRCEAGRSPAEAIEDALKLLGDHGLVRRDPARSGTWLLHPRA